MPEPIGSSSFLAEILVKTQSESQGYTIFEEHFHVLCDISKHHRTKQQSAIQFNLCLFFSSEKLLWKGQGTLCAPQVSNPFLPSLEEIKIYVLGIFYRFILFGSFFGFFLPLFWSRESIMALETKTHDYFVDLS